MNHTQKAHSRKDYLDIVYPASKIINSFWYEAEKMAPKDSNWDNRSLLVVTQT